MQFPFLFVATSELFQNFNAMLLFFIRKPEGKYIVNCICYSVLYYFELGFARGVFNKSRNFQNLFPLSFPTKQNKYVISSIMYKYSCTKILCL